MDINPEAQLKAFEALAADPQRLKAALAADKLAYRAFIEENGPVEKFYNLMLEFFPDDAIHGLPEPGTDSATGISVGRGSSV
jgi:hypothetical protein